jgi:LysM repeat protein
MLASPSFRSAKRTRRSYSPLVIISAILVLGLIVGLVCGWFMLETVASYYASRMYPNVYVLGLKLGRLSPEEASALLRQAAPPIDTGLLVLRAGEDHWSIPWSQAGVQLDVPATVEAAFAVGHTGDLGWGEQAREWLRRHEVSPIHRLDARQARGILEGVAPSIAVTPADATIRLSPGSEEAIVVVPGTPGRELDIDASLTRIMAAAEARSQDGAVDLVLRAIPPQVMDVTAAVEEVEGMLNRQINVSTYDLVTDKAFSWTLGRQDIVAWLRVSPSSEGPEVDLDLNGVRASLSRLATDLGDGRGFQLEEAVRQVAEVFDAGGGTVNLYVTHAPRTYIVQAGDSLSSIAAKFGMTAWHVLHANPDLDPDWLSIGQELTIPSQDELTPYPPVPGKRIVVSIEEQRLRAYENGELVFDWPVSTGIKDSPTHTGVFQILDKEENAYASQWDLWMPHFLAVYAAGPGFYNGFHGLPTLSGGGLLWEGLLGRPASYGCIILGLEEAETLYQWADVGVVAVIE